MKTLTNTEVQAVNGGIIVGLILRAVFKCAHEDCK